jgi:tRNA (guanine37-N1)-methyltransferase
MFDGPLQESILRRAQDKGLAAIRVHDLRGWTHDRHRVVDDVPYGGGAGMVLKPEPVFEAVDALRQGPATTVVALTPQGIPFSQRLAAELACLSHLILLCGIPALVVLDATVRLIPGVLGDETSALTDSFATGLLEHPHYTRPPTFRGMSVPPVLLSGDHQAIARWRRKQALRRTQERRPDLLRLTTLSDADRDLLAEVEAEDAGISGTGHGVTK